MLKGILILFIFQLVGEFFVEIFSLHIPPSIVGMIFLLCFLIVKDNYSTSLESTVFFFLKYLPIFILPTAVGIISQFQIISNELASISICLFSGTIASLIISGKIMEYSINKGFKKDE